MTALPDLDIHPDHAATERIRTALDETLFVEAGAGSGKTRALVDRVMALVLDAGEPLHAVAAITFTEKAAAELRDRVRDRLDGIGAAARRDGRTEVVAACAAALDDLDGAAIGTLHSFAQRILSEHPVEAGLPPRVEVLDEVASLVAFDDRWAELVDDLLDAEAMARPILLLTAAGVRLTALREIALSFNQNWDLVAERAPTEAPPLPEWESRFRAIVDAVEQACDEQEHCSDDSDPLCCLLKELDRWVQQVRTAPDESARLALTRPEGGRPRTNPNGKGAKPRWVKGYDLPALRAQLKDLLEQCDLLANEVTHVALQQVAVELRRFTLVAAEHRRRDGRLEFHDLLVMARQVLRDPTNGPAVRAALHDRYRRLLLDEFQDTDPIQVELAVLVASPDPDAGAKPWQEIEPAPGRLFFVGDPKQSIYRFRRADIALFLQAAEHFGGGVSGHRLALTTNHRSGHDLVEWINGAFGRLITPGPTAFSQPGFEPSVAVRPDAAVGPPVSVLGRTAHGDGPSADELRAREAADVATAVSRILGEGWHVDRSPDWQDPDWQPARAGDITILLPTRLSLPFLEDALTEAGHAYRVESASLVYGGRLVRDVFLTLRAVDDPSDELSVVAALRSALFGCGDDDLFVFRQAGGTFDHTATPPDTVPDHDPVRAGLAYLGDLHRERRWRTPSEMVDRVVRDRRVLELGGNEGRARDLWQRMRFVVDQARAWTDTTHGTLRQYLDWVRQQSSPGSRVAEAVLPETDDDAVRIMTVHAAKGLQFPITIVAGLSTLPQSRLAGAQVVWPPDGSCLLNVGKKVTSPAFEAWRPLDEQMSHDERIRLLYVACTRARDHLVVSLHRRARASAAAFAARLSNAELLAETLGAELDDLPDATVGAALPLVAPTRRIEVDPPAASTLPAFEAWRAEREAALTAGSRPRTVAATALTDEGEPDAESDPGLQKRPGDLDLPPWRKGRYGTAVGRAVHGVLQLIDLATGAGLDELVAAQAAAEGVTGHEDHVATLVRAALDSPTVAEAAAGAHWREVYVAVPLGGGQTLEGYVDLLYRRPDGRLVVVDYKTGPESPDDPLDDLVERYRLQGSSYALAVAEATGEPVDDVVFLFLTPTGATPRHLDDVPTAIATTRTLIESNTFTQTP
jgi:ATP-dependent exoDNAse (exonuclease V) beta subunit